MTETFYNCSCIWLPCPDHNPLFNSFRFQYSTTIDEYNRDSRIDCANINTQKSHDTDGFSNSQSSKQNQNRHKSFNK